MPVPSRLLIVTVFALLTLIWGTTWAAIRIGLQGVPPFTGVAIRFGIAAIVLLILVKIRGIKLGRTRTERLLWVANALLGFCVSYGIIYWAEQWVPSGLTSVLFATLPLFVAIQSHFMLPEEKLTVRSVAGVLIGFAGVAVIFSEDLTLLGGPRVAFASAVVLLSPFVAALTNVAIKRWGEGIHPFSLAAVPMAITAVVMGCVALTVERGAKVVFDATSVAALLYLSLAGSVVTFSLLYWLLSKVTAASASLIAYTVPVVAVGVGIIFLDEVLTMHTLAGSILVVLGVFLALWARARGREAPSPSSASPPSEPPPTSSD